MTIPTVIGVLLALLVLVAVFGLGFVYIYWWMIQRPLPQHQGTLILDCLDGPVDIVRDRHGIPHIEATTEEDLWRAQGFVHAQDRLWQMEQQRRIANGTLAELFGEAALDADRFSRIIGFRRAAEAELAQLDPQVLQVLERYCEGVNAYIRSRPGRLAAEFNLLRFQPDPWQPVDVVAFAKVMGWSLSLNWQSELTRLQLAQRLDPARAADLEPDYPAHNPIVAEGVGSQEATRLVHTAGLILGEYERIRPWLGPMADGLGQGSNAWAVAAERSLTGRPLLCGDPHLNVSMPGIWYEIHLSCPTLKVAGASFPGAPGVIIGHNERVAWSFTNSGADVQDLYIERPHPEDPHRFEHNGQWEQATVLEEVIHVRRRPTPHVETVVITRHGPLINGLVSDQATVPLALRWIGHEPSQQLRAILGINRAQDWEAFDRALADWAVPVQNVVYADVDNTIAYRLAGRVPIRRSGFGLVPMPGWTDAHEWEGTIPDGELPRVVNPPSGLLVSANNKPVGDDYPYFLGLEFMPGWRARRIEEMLRAKRQVGIRDMEEIQLDTTSTYAEVLTPILTGIVSDDPLVRTALRLLRNWRYRMEPDSGGALVFHYTLLHLLQMTFGEKLGAAAAGYLGQGTGPLFLITGMKHRAITRLLELLQQEEQSVWYTDARTGRPRRREELIHEALRQATRRIRKEVHSTPRHWAWGRVHQVRFAHPMGGVRILGAFFNRGPFPVGGDGTTPCQMDHPLQLPPGLVQVIPTYRQIIDVGRWDEMRSVTSTGQSGHPLHRNYTDQIPLWLEGVYHPMPWSWPEVEDIGLHTLHLRPPTP